VAGIDPTAYPRLIEELTAITMSAAEAIRHAQSEGGVRAKADGSPVTQADEAAEDVIRQGLARLDQALPVVSEEAAEKERPSVGRDPYFLVDPLDGTREFIAGRDEYTVNIAVVADGAPVLGVVAQPALGLIWRGIVGRGAERLEFAGHEASAPQPIKTRKQPDDELVVVVSRSHLEARTQAYLEQLPNVRRISSGSSIKFCRLAEGAADLYPRLAPTHDWDIAAGHAILFAAGGCVVAPDGSALTYGTPELLIPAFIAWGRRTPPAWAPKADS